MSGLRPGAYQEPCKDSIVAMEPHNWLLRQAARDVLRPMGLTQRGRSRVWWDDHALWVIMVEFQASAFAKGTYLNVGIGWLWTPEPTAHGPGYGYGHRVPGYGGLYESPEQWEPIAYAAANKAASEVAKYRQLVPDVGAAADVCAEHDGDRFLGWPNWNAAVSAGLAGKIDESERRFAAVCASNDDRDWWLRAKERAGVLGRLVRHDHSAFVKEMAIVVNQNRSFMKLAPVALDALPAIGLGSDAEERAGQ